MGFMFNSENFQAGMRSYKYRVAVALGEMFTKYAEKTTAEMKEGVGVPAWQRQGKGKRRGQTLIGHPWVDRTGEAKRRLKALYINDDFGSTNYRLRLQHGVDYGIWLEFAHEKKYAIIIPTLRRIYPIMIEDIRRQLQKIVVDKSKQ